jgi:hypothetical protein
MKSLLKRPVIEITRKDQRRYHRKTREKLFRDNPEGAKQWVIHMVSGRDITKMRTMEVDDIVCFGIEVTDCEFTNILFCDQVHWLPIARFVLEAIQRGVYPWPK